jgi:peptidoglycan/LPS O-acetylase OafA/YrhL
MNSLKALLAPAQNQRGYRPDIEGLRGIAVLLVVLYHMGIPSLRGGFIGVDVFFVLSGYLITGILTRSVEEGRGLGFAEFYARRVRRLLPASLLVLVATCLVIPVAFPPTEQVLFSRAARATALYVSNLWFLFQTSDYFGAAAEFNPFLHTWSLGVEEQFYLVWPLLLWAGFRGRGDRRRAALLLGVVGLISYAASLWYTFDFLSAAFYLMPLRAWEFAAGGLLVLRRTEVRREEERLNALVGFLGLGLILVSGVVVRSYALFPGVTATLPTIGTLAVLAAGERRDWRGASGLLTFWPLQVLGRLSYSWYLWHWPVGLITNQMLPDPGILAGTLAATGSLGLSVLTYLFVEHPARHNRWFAVRPKETLALAGVATVLAATVVASTSLRPDDLARSQLMLDAILDRGRIHETNCELSEMRTELRECTAVENEEGLTVVLIGDSHASHWLPALERVAENRGWRVLTHIKRSCPISGVEVFSRPLGRINHECSTWREAVIDRMRSLHPDVVIVGQASHKYFRQGASPEEWGRGLADTMTRLAASTGHLAVLRDTPLAPEDVPACLSRAAWKNEDLGQCDFPDDVVVGADRMDEVERAVLGGIQKVSYLDFTDLICPDGICPAIVDSVVRFQDDHHLTASFVETLTPTIEERLLTVLGEGGS